MSTVEHVEREFFNLFIGVGRGELMPYGSFYLTGFLHERPLARLREDLKQARHRAHRRQCRAGRSRRHTVRDYGRAGGWRLRQ
ncbi:MAG: molecular chaperone TorD family protein [Pseudolabrys sp.]